MACARCAGDVVRLATRGGSFPGGDREGAVLREHCPRRSHWRAVFSTSASSWILGCGHLRGIIGPVSSTRRTACSSSRTSARATGSPWDTSRLRASSTVATIACASRRGGGTSTAGAPAASPASPGESARQLACSGAPRSRPGAHAVEESSRKRPSPRSAPRRRGGGDDAPENAAGLAPPTGVKVRACNHLSSA